MSKYLYRSDPDTIDLVDDVGYDESELDQMSSEDVHDIAKRKLADPTVRRA
jgi:hypothetical protein